MTRATVSCAALQGAAGRGMKCVCGKCVYVCVSGSGSFSRRTQLARKPPAAGSRTLGGRSFPRVTQLALDSLPLTELGRGGSPGLGPSLRDIPGLTPGRGVTETQRVKGARLGARLLLPPP